MNQNRQAPIGVFDSGVGGLTVAREIMRNLPSERIVYFGDTARVPYGSKSKEIVLKFSRQIVRFLQLQDVKAIVVACNTASALALEEIKKEIDIPIIGVVEPGAKVEQKERFILNCIRKLFTDMIRKFRCLDSRVRFLFHW